LQKEWKPGATTISEELEGIGCLSTEGGQRKDNNTIVQPVLHYCLRIVQVTLVSLLVNSPYNEWILNYSLLSY